MHAAKKLKIKGNGCQHSIDFILLLSTSIIILFFCLTDFVFGKQIVTQVPNEIHIRKGESVTLTCRWNITDAERIRVEWRKRHKLHLWDDNGTQLSNCVWTHPNNTTTYTQMNQNRSSCAITNDTAMMTLESITEEDEGLYVCKMVSEIPTLISGQGNGTLLHNYNNKSEGKRTYLLLYMKYSVHCNEELVIY